MTSAGRVACGMGAAILWIAGIWLVTQLPGKAEDFAHGVAYTIALGALILSGLILALQGCLAKPCETSDKQRTLES